MSDKGRSHKKKWPHDGESTDGILFDDAGGDERPLRIRAVPMRRSEQLDDLAGLETVHLSNPYLRSA